MRAAFNQLLNVSSMDAEDARRRKLLNILLIGVVGLSLLIVVYLAVVLITTGQVVDSQTQLLFISIGITIGAIGIIYLINRYWSGPVASSLFLLILIGTMATGDTPEQVIDGIVLFLFTIPIIMAGVLIRPWASFVVAILITALVTFIGLQANLRFNPTFAAGFIAIALVTWLAMRSLEAALSDLHKINAELDNLVAERTRELYEALRQVSTESSKNEAILQSIADGVIVFDAEGKAFASNDASVQLLGRESAKITGSTLKELMGSSVASDEQELLTEFLGKSHDAHTHMRIQWDKRVLSVSAAEVRGTGNTSLGTVVVFRDFTREAELERMKSAFLSMASHELRTPLNAILGYTDMLKAGIYGPMNDEQTTASERVIANVHRMLGLVNNLLDQAQIEAGGLKPNFVPFDIKHLVADVQATMQVLASQRETKITTNIGIDVPDQLVSDPQRLQQIMINLVGNAAKFTEKGTIDIKVALTDPKSWSIAIRDTGPGIPDDAQKYIFEPFRQIEDPIRRKHGGTGLGLSIVKDLTELLGGEIALESAVGVGSTFTAVFPLEPIKEPVA